MTLNYIVLRIQNSFIGILYLCLTFVQFPSLPILYLALHIFNSIQQVQTGCNVLCTHHQSMDHVVRIIWRIGNVITLVVRMNNIFMLIFYRKL